MGNNGIYKMNFSSNDKTTIRTYYYCNTIEG